MDADQKMPRSFTWLNVAQFGGALNDNIFKLLVIFFLIGLQGPDSASRVVVLVGAIFVVPFLLFTTGAGVLADRYSKRHIVVIVKALEILAMSLAVCAFYFKSPWMVYTVLFLMSAQSALFGPSKYGILVELVGRHRLSRANSLLVLFTYLAIMLGTAAAPTVDKMSHGNYVVAGLVCLGIAIAGLFASLQIEKTPAKGGTNRISTFIVLQVWRTMRSLRSDGFLTLAVWASAYFLLIGAFVQLNLIPYGLHMLGISEQNSGYLFLIAAVGIGFGAWLVGKISGRNIEFGIVPVGIFGVTLGTLGLFLFPHSLPIACGWIFLLGVSSGFFVVPLDAFIQARSPDDRRGEILAASGFLSWVGVLLAALLIWIFSEGLGLNPAQGFLWIGVLTFVLAVLSFIVLPDFFVRFVMTLVMKGLYRIRIIGEENVPAEGPALLVANHVSWVDALLLGATQRRRIRFMMYRQIYENRWLNPLFRLMGVIPISYQDPPKKILASLMEARAALDDGYMVCIFAEGSVTRSGMLQEFRGGFERIVRNSSIPVIPVYLGGVWGSIFSYFHGKPMTRWPAMIPYPVGILFGKPLPPTTSAYEVRDRVMELSVDYFNDLKPRRHSIGEELIIGARHHWSKRCISDTTGKSLTFGQGLTAAVALASIVEKGTEGQRHIGILLPSSVGGALANMAVTLLRKVTVNLNYVASNDFRRHVVEQCDLQKVITSRRFLEKMPGMEPPPGAIYLEDLMPRITSRLKVRSYLKARFLPRRLLARSSGFKADELATVMFSSGATGVPKGVLLSHHNILSNVEAFRMVYRPTEDDNLCAALPFFHSFGFTATLWFPLLSGFSASYHVNPLDGAQIANVVRESRSTLLFATPTFLLNYVRKAEKEDFKSLRAVIVGAEKLKKNVADMFEEKFGVRPLEGYGSTECAPVIAVNLPPVDIDGVHQAGAKEGSVGHPLPGVAVRVVEPSNYEPVAQGAEGLMLVRGPNVMLGYLNQPEKTAEVFHDGWYVTGDIVRIDRDGFITITDRLSRFSKIAGEMVPLIAVEDMYHQALKAMEPVLTVTSVPDARRGERLIVLYTEASGGPERLHALIQASDLPNLWKPDRQAYYPIDAIPTLGSGKTDFKALRDLARQAIEG